MASIECPHCQQKTFSWWDGYRAGKWAIITCKQCGERACAQPVVMIGIYFLYMWDVMLFGYLTYLESLWFLPVLLVGWFILDYFSLYIPLASLKKKRVSSDAEKSAEKES